jgi:hypothetical protein
MNKIIDGKIDETQYDNSTLKVLWILKEANVSPEDKEKEEIDLCAAFRENWHIKNSLSIPTFRKIIYATYGIFYPEVEWKNVPYANEEAYEVVKKIAYININKYPADSSSNDWKIKEAYNQNRVELLKQIKNLKPNIIIFGNTLKYFEYDDLAKIGWQISETEKKYANEKTTNTAFYMISSDKLCINAYHPSYPKITDKIYWNEIRNAFSIWKLNKL